MFFFPLSASEAIQDSRFGIAEVSDHLNLQVFRKSQIPLVNTTMKKLVKTLKTNKLLICWEKLKLGEISRQNAENKHTFEFDGNDNNQIFQFAMPSNAWKTGGNHSLDDLEIRGNET